MLRAISEIFLLGCIGYTGGKQAEVAHRASLTCMEVRAKAALDLILRIGVAGVRLDADVAAENRVRGDTNKSAVTAATLGLKAAIPFSFHRQAGPRGERLRAAH